MHAGIRKTWSSDLPYNSSVLRLHALRGMHVPEYCIARVEPQSGFRQFQDSGTEYWKFTARTMQIPVFRTWILRLSANLSRKFTRFSAWILTLSALRHWLSVDFRLSESWGLDIMHDWRFNQFSVFSALNLEIGRDEILDWRAAYYVNFGDVIDSSAVLMTWSICTGTVSTVSTGTSVPVQ